VTHAHVTVLEFAGTVAEVVGRPGKIICDPSKPDGTSRKLVDISRLSALGWRAKISLREGLAKAYADFPDKSNAREMTVSQHA